MDLTQLRYADLRTCQTLTEQVERCPCPATAPALGNIALHVPVRQSDISRRRCQELATRGQPSSMHFTKSPILTDTDSCAGEDNCDATTPDQIRQGQDVLTQQKHRRQACNEHGSASMPDSIIAVNEQSPRPTSMSLIRSLAGSADHDVLKLRLSTP
jgi:hypothetical protein